MSACRRQPIGNSEFHAFDDRIAQFLVRALCRGFGEWNLLPFDDFHELGLIALGEKRPKHVLALPVHETEISF